MNCFLQWTDTKSDAGFSIQDFARVESRRHIAESDTDIGRTSWCAREQWVSNGHKSSLQLDVID